MNARGDSKGPGFVLGTNSMGWTADRDTSHDILDRYCESGHGIIDTAQSYRSPAWAGPDDDEHTSEGVIGSWFAARRPAAGEVTIVTKVRGSLAPERVLAATEQSRDRLHVDRIDIMYAHEDDAAVPLSETIDAFEELRVRGVIGGVGLSMYSAARIREWITTADRLGVARPVAVMRKYNLLDRRRFEHIDRPVLEEYDVAAYAYFVLASGFLTGKFDSPAAVAASDRGKMTSMFVSEEGFTLVGVLREVASEVGVTPAEVATAWVASRRAVTAPVVGVRSTRQLESAFRAASLTLDRDVIARLDRASAPFA